jgi:hypothetical protein
MATAMNHPALHPTPARPPSQTSTQTPGPAPALNALQRFIDDELLRAPLLFDQVVDGSVDALRKAMASAGPVHRTALVDLTQALRAQRAQMCDYFVRSLREQTTQALQVSRLQPAHAPKVRAPSQLALVDEDEVAVDVELARTIEAIRNTAEYELQELQTFVSALVGDMDVAHEHNPFGPECHARALWAASHGLQLSRGHQVSFMHHAGTPLAQALRLSFAAASARLEELGIEPASYRTLILPSGSRRSARSVHTTFSPDLHGMRQTMPAAIDSGATRAMSLPAQPSQSRAALPWREVARQAGSHADRQSVELVSRLFDALLDDTRIPGDVQNLIARLHGPALRLTLRDASMLDQDVHPLWRFVNRLAYEAEMAPEAADPERARLFKVALATIEQIQSEPEQSAALYRWAHERLETFLQQRLVRRLAALSTHVATLQKLEDKLCAGTAAPTTLSGTLDMSQLDTVPAALLADSTADPAADTTAASAHTESEIWLNSLRPGDWVRMFMQGRWVRAQLLWPGERREVWLFGDGASDATWAVRRRALLAMRTGALMKTLKQRSLVRSAAARLQQQLTPPQAA